MTQHLVFIQKENTLSVKMRKKFISTQIFPISIHKWATINHSVFRCRVHYILCLLRRQVIICSFPFPFLNKWWICHWALKTKRDSCCRLFVYMRHSYTTFEKKEKTSQKMMMSMWRGFIFFLSLSWVRYV